MGYYTIATCQQSHDEILLFVDGETVYGKFRGKTYHELPYHIEDSCYELLDMLSARHPDCDFTPSEDGVCFGLPTPKAA